MDSYFLDVSLSIEKACVLNLKYSMEKKGDSGRGSKLRFKEIRFNVG